MSSITELPPGERPRERLNALGPEALTGRELMALLVGSGGRGTSALGIADEVLASVEGSLRTLGSVSPSAIAAIPGVGMATGARITAALELGRRASAEVRHPGELVRGPRDVFDRMEPRLRDLPQEEFHALLLSARHSVIREVLITRGILDASLIHPREVFRPAITESAAAIILVHNHPSGDPTPSVEDRAVTKQLSAAGRTVGIHVVDHVVIGDGHFASLADDGPLG
jgi:DNA repair protein RadC